MIKRFFNAICLIGAGNMGGAMIRAFLDKKLVLAKNIIILERDPEKQKTFEKLGVRCASSMNDITSLPVIIFAIKPQQFSDVAQKLHGKISPSTVVISIMAGVPISKLEKELNHQKIVRAMPNTPGMIQQGVVGWYAKNLVKEELGAVSALLSSLGFCFEVKEEDILNDVTALSGSGSGFFLYIVKAWQDAAKNLHLDEKLTNKALLETFKGSLALLEKTGKTPEELVQQVASKGGTTEAGLGELKKANLHDAFSKTLLAAYNRCKRLGR